MELTKTDFTKNIVRINSLQFSKWIFEPGMLFMSGSKWWGDKGKRTEQHNGLDLFRYEAIDGTYRTIDAGTKVPIIYEGRIVRCVKDFLGYSHFAAHDIHEGDLQLFTIYGHLLQAPDISIGDHLDEGAVIAALNKKSGASVPGHIHISVALIPKAIPFDALSWIVLNEADNVHFLDPAIIL